MLTSIQLVELQDGALRALDLTEGHFACPTGPITSPIREPEFGLFEIRPSSKDPWKLPYADASVVKVARDAAPRHALVRGKSTRERDALLEQMIHRAGGKPIGTLGRDQWVAGLADWFIGSLGGRMSDMTIPLMIFFGSLIEPPSEQELRAVVVRALENGSTHDGAEGRALDEAQKLREDELELRAAKLVVEDAVAPMQNTRTCRELNVVLISISEALAEHPDGIPPLLRGYALGPSGWPSLAMSRMRLLSDGERLYIPIAKGALLGRFREAHGLAFGCAVESEDFIPPCTDRELKSKTVADIGRPLRDYLLRFGRPGKKVRPSERFGHASIEGWTRAAQLKELALPFASELLAKNETLDFLASAALDGLALSDKMAARVLTEVAKEEHARVFLKPAHWDEEEARKVKSSFRAMADGRLIGYAACEWQVPRMHSMYLNEAELLGYLAAAPVVFVANELAVEASPSALDALYRTLPWLDPFRAVIAKITDEEIRGQDVEARCLGEGVDASGPQRQRIHALMSAGFDQARTSAPDGSRPRTWKRKP